MKKFIFMGNGASKSTKNNCFAVSGNNNVVVNGQNLNSFFNNLNTEYKEIEDIKEENMYNNDIKINDVLVESSFVNIFIKKSLSSNTKATLKGHAYVSGKLELSISKNDNTLEVKVISEESISNSNLELYVEIPRIESLNVHTSSGNIIADKDTSVHKISCSSQSGNINGTIKSEYSNIKTQSGNILITLIGEKDSNCDCHSMSGNIDLELCNFSSANINSCTMSGYVRNNFNKNKNSKFIAISDLETMSGNIFVK